MLSITSKREDERSRPWTRQGGGYEMATTLATSRTPPLSFSFLSFLFVGPTETRTHSSPELRLSTRQAHCFRLTAAVRGCINSGTFSALTGETLEVVYGRIHKADRPLSPVDYGCNRAPRRAPKTGIIVRNIQPFCIKE